MADAALIVLQARMSSTRCPGKVLAELAGRPLLEHCISRLRHSAVGPVVVATSTQPEDDAVASLAARLGVAICRGPLDDVLARFALATASWTGPYVIRATGDNPAVDIEGPGRVLQRLQRGADYVVESGLPAGSAVEGVRTTVLRRAARMATLPYDREHVTPFVKSRPEEFVVDLPSAPAVVCRPDLRLTVDTPEDLAFVRAVFAEAAPEGPSPSLLALIAAADRLGSAGGERR